MRSVIEAKADEAREIRIELTSLNLIAAEEAQRYVRRDALIVHVSDVCHVEPLEAMQLMLAAFVLASAAFMGCLQITMSR